MKLRLYYPTYPYKLHQGFGVCLPSICSKYRELGLNGHNGEDLWAPDGHEVRAAHDGIVTFAGYDGSGGLGIVIRTTAQYEYKDSQAFFKTIYWHLKEQSPRVRASQEVKAGDIIALADNTGMSTGSHLHFGLKPIHQGENDWEWWNAEDSNGFKGAIDPAPFWTGIHSKDIGLTISLYQSLVASLMTILNILRSSTRQ